MITAKPRVLVCTRQICRVWKLRVHIHTYIIIYIYIYTYIYIYICRIYTYSLYLWFRLHMVLTLLLGNKAGKLRLLGEHKATYSQGAPLRLSCWKWQVLWFHVKVDDKKTANENIGFWVVYILHEECRSQLGSSSKSGYHIPSIG